MPNDTNTHFTDDELREATQEMRDKGLPTMGAWATRTNKTIGMTPDTIRTNERLHARDYLIAKQQGVPVEKIDPTAGRR